MSFLTKEDFKTHIDESLIDAISDSDDEILDDAIATAMAIAEDRLSRFNTEAIFASYEPKYAALRTYIKDIAKWNFIKLSPLNLDLETAKDCYDIAIKELDKYLLKITPKGWPLAVEDSNEQEVFIIISSDKRENYI